MKANPSGIYTAHVFQLDKTNIGILQTVFRLKNKTFRIEFPHSLQEGDNGGANSFIHSKS